MTEIAYRSGELHIEDVQLSRIADAVGTPFYAYSSAALERRYHVFADEGQLPDDSRTGLAGRQFLANPLDTIGLADD